MLVKDLPKSGIFCSYILVKKAFILRCTEDPSFVTLKIEFGLDNYTSSRGKKSALAF